MIISTCSACVNLHQACIDKVPPLPALHALKGLVLEAAGLDSEPTHIEAIPDASVSYCSLAESKDHMGCSLPGGSPVLQLDPPGLLDGSHW